jgi:nucleotide-binding universal stress UspA family protein/hemerythrin-like domain-containing protein
MATMQRILCAVDFSECSRRAFDRAIAIARAENAPVTALHVAPAGPQFDAQRIEHHMERFLDIDGSSGVDVTCVAREGTEIDTEILTAAKTLHADVIVMGTHGRSGIERLMLGSIAAKVVRKSESAVVTVPLTSVEKASLRRAPFQRILCAIDFSEWSLAALRYAISLAERHNARLAMCHVIDLMAPIYDPVVGPQYDPLSSAPVERAYRTASEIVTRERLRSLIAPEVRSAIAIDEIVVKGKPQHDLVELAGTWRSDLIVMGTHGRHVIDRAVFGSTVEPVLRRAPCPVLTVSKWRAVPDRPKEHAMLQDRFENERYRVERVLEILEHAASRLEAHAYIPLTILSDAVAFIRATEDAAYEASQTSAGKPALSACIDQHLAARVPLVDMAAALRELEHGNADVAPRFVRSAREYVRLRRDHLRADDRLFATAAREPREASAPDAVESVETRETRRIYDRLVEASGILDIGVPTNQW